MSRTTKLCGAAATLAGTLVGLMWAFTPAAAAAESPPAEPRVNVPCPSCPGGYCPLWAQPGPAIAETAVRASAAIERAVPAYGRQRGRPLRNLIQRIRARRHVTPTPEPTPQPEPSPSPLPPPQPASGLTVVVFEDVGKRQPWQGVVDKYAEDALRDKDGTSHYRRYDVSVLDKNTTPAGLENRWQIVKSKPLPQIVIENSGKLLYAGTEPQTVADFQALLRQYPSAAAGAAGRAAPCSAVRVRFRLPLLRTIRKARNP